MDARTGPGGPASDTEVLQVHAAADVAALLRRLIAEGTPLHLSAPGGVLHAARLSMLDAARRRIGFDSAPAAPGLRALLGAAELVAAGDLDAAQLQFEVAGLLLVHGARGWPLQAALPPRLLRIRRRQPARARPHEPHPVARLYTGGARALSLRVLDLGAQGCTLLLPHGVAPLPPGQRIPLVEIEAGDEAPLRLAIEVLNVTCMGSDTDGVRVGCRILDWLPDAQRVARHARARLGLSS